MFIGHLALGLAAKRVTPRVSLGMLLLASQWADAIWPVFLILGLEQVQIAPGNTAYTPLAFVSYPYSHSLAALIVWGVLVGGAYRGIAGGRRTVWVLGALVVSHWGLDYLTHGPDMPLYPGSARYGLGLWNSIPATMAVELVMFAAGLLVYLRTTRPRDAAGRWGLLSLVALLLVIDVLNVVSSPPASTTVLAIGALAGAVVLTIWAWWADRHRDVVR
jgi:membrane-bound metal-dependent hydrolase YbcI (DUF457 family)